MTMMTGVPAGDVAGGGAAGDAASGDAAAAASTVEYVNNGRAMAGIGTVTTGRACGAVRADGSLCKLRVMVGSSGVCPFHGAWVARGADGRPFAPPEGSVWSRVLTCERQALAGSTGAVVGVGDASGVSTAFRATTEAPARTIEEDRKRARLDFTASGTSTAATSSGAAVCRAPSASAGAPEKRKSKPPPTARERLAAKLAATARATANAVAAHSIKSMEMMHRSHNQGW